MHAMPHPRKYPHNETEQPLLGIKESKYPYRKFRQVPRREVLKCIIGCMVLPSNFDNPDEAMAIARTYARIRERKYLGEKLPKPEQQQTNNTEKQNDTAK